MNKDAKKEKDTNLRLCSLHLQNFRSYTQLDLEGFGKTVLIVGPNAIGKTNIIEAIQMMTSLQSFRSHKAAEMIKWGEDHASAETNICGNGRDLDLKLSISQSRRSYSLNGKNRPIHDLQGILPAVTFCPDDLQLVKSSDSIRREAIDTIACQLSKNYRRVRHDYYSLLRQKNKALKDEVSDAYIESLNDVLVKVGLQFIRLRTVMIQKIRHSLNMYYNQISSENTHLDILYTPSWLTLNVSREQNFSECNTDKSDTSPLFYYDEYEFDRIRDIQAFSLALTQALPDERRRKHCLIGPQADHLKFALNGRDASHFASQGQQRSIVLAYKFAEVNAIQETLDQTPILLLDDVMSELDSTRREKLITFAAQDIQTFITSTSADVIPESVVNSSQIIRLPLENNQWTGTLRTFDV